MTEKKKTIRSLAEELKAIRKRPVPLEKIDEFNKIVERDQKQPEPDKKIARSPEAEI